jgi:DNA-binding transcriptional regulator YdaS (Cro superfamily)
MDESPPPILALRRAVEIVGSASAMAARLGVSHTAVRFWLENKHPLAGEHVLPIEAATRELGQEVSRHDLRPDLYPREPVLHESRR